jgi:hypothetical protein
VVAGMQISLPRIDDDGNSRDRIYRVRR